MELEQMLLLAKLSRDAMQPALYYRDFSQMLDYWNIATEFTGRAALNRTIAFQLERDAKGFERWELNRRIGLQAQKVNGVWRTPEREVGEWDAHHLDRIISFQTTRLEMSYISMESWFWNEWRDLFLHQPYMRQAFAEGLVWCAHLGKYPYASFIENSYATFGTLFFHVPLGDDLILDENDKPVDMESVAGSLINLAHPAIMPSDLVQAWLKKFHEYEIVQPFPQLMRPRDIETASFRMPDSFDHLAYIGLKVDPVTTQDYNHIGQRLLPSHVYDIGTKRFRLAEKYGSIGWVSSTFHHDPTHDYELTIPSSEVRRGAEISYQFHKYIAYMKEQGY